MSEAQKDEFVSKVQILLMKGYDVTVRAEWSAPGETIHQTVVGKVFFKTPLDPCELAARWDDNPTVQ